MTILGDDFELQNKEEINMNDLINRKRDSFVGYYEVELVDDHSEVTFPMSIMYPTSVQGRVERIGQYSLDVSINSALKEGVYPLIIISHGSGGSHLLYRTLAYHLASNGFIVGMPEHPFNNRNNNKLAGTVENLENRPRHLSIAINWFFNSKKFSKFLKPNSVSIIGHSMGGYTALAVAGGMPTSFPNESLDGQTRKINVTNDSRIKALVLLAPAAVWFREKGALSKVDIPILMLAGEKDEYTPQYHSKIVLEGVPDINKIQYRVIKNPGHFSFLSPFPKSMISETFLPSQDPAGFDRERFHHELNDEVLKFLLSETY